MIIGNYQNLMLLNDCFFLSKVRTLVILDTCSQFGLSSFTSIINLRFTSRHVIFHYNLSVFLFVKRIKKSRMSKIYGFFCLEVHKINVLKGLNSLHK